MANYQETLTNFQQQWNLPNYNLDRLAESVQALRFADSFLMGSSSDNSPESQFMKWFSRTLSLYFESNTTPNEDGKYISSFDAKAFFNSFKNLVQAKYDADAMEKNVKLLNVEDVTLGQNGKIKNVIVNRMRNYNKTLPTLWQENLKKGYLKFDTLKAITDNSYAAFEDNHDEKELDAKLTNLVAAREAMRQLRESRSGVWGWLWKVIFNREQNRQEKTYLQDLNNKINALRGTYNVDAKVADLTGKTVFGKTVAEEKAKTQEEPAKKLSKPAKIKPCAKKISDKYYDSELSGRVVNELLTKIPIPGAEDYRRKVLETMVVNPAFKDINNLNAQFDQDIKNGNQKDAVAKLVRGVFKVADRHNSLIRSGSGVDKFDAIAIIAQTFIDNLTAVSIYPQLRGDANEYIKNNNALYKEIVEEDYVYSEKIDDYAVDYVPSVKESHERVFGEENPFIENVGNKSPQISEPSQISAPSLDIK